MTVRTVINHLNASQRISLTILVAALGYFVDVFDLQLFAILRVNSLKSFGLSLEQITSTGAMLMNWQMAGFLAGGIVWGILGDRKGRVSTLFGTILLYSISNIVNGFVTTIPAYAAARFFTGMGLAGEVGVGVTLLSELLPKEKRGYACTVMIGIGVLGPVVASMVADLLAWRTAYIAGGVLGLLLLTMRIAVSESGLFTAAQNNEKLSRGNFLMLFKGWKRLKNYLCCVGIGIPNWFVAGILLVFSPEIGIALKASAPLKVSHAVITYSVGLAIGCTLSGLFSQLFRSRRKVMFVYILGLIAVDCVALSIPGISAEAYYGLICMCGFFMGYWTLFVTTTAELFGTNLRATATTTVTNFVRGSVILDVFFINFLKPTQGFLTAMIITALVGGVIALISLWNLPETFNNDMDFVET